MRPRGDLLSLRVFQCPVGIEGGVWRILEVMEARALKIHPDDDVAVLLSPAIAAGTRIRIGTTEYLTDQAIPPATRSRYMTLLLGMSCVSSASPLPAPRKPSRRATGCTRTMPRPCSGPTRRTSMCHIAPPLAPPPSLRGVPERRSLWGICGPMVKSGFAMSCGCCARWLHQ